MSNRQHSTPQILRKKSRQQRLPTLRIKRCQQITRACKQSLETNKVLQTFFKVLKNQIQQSIVIDYKNKKLQRVLNKHAINLSFPKKQPKKKRTRFTPCPFLN
jgi:chorismate mutase